MDHIGIPITDAARTRSFYAACLAPLGWTERGYAEGRYVGFHKAGELVLYFAVAKTIGEVHLAFDTSDHDRVRAFHAAAIANGGTDNGPPGPRPSYGAAYFAAFVRDPDGHNVEALVGGVRAEASQDFSSSDAQRETESV